MKLDKKIQAKKLLTRAATLALLVKERKRATAVRKQTAAAVHVKQQEALEKKLTAALSPMFSRQIDSAIKKLNQHEDLHGVRAWMLLDPSEWDDEIVNRALPPMAKAMAEAMLTEVVMFEKDLRRYVKSTRLMRRAVKVFCPTGEGGGVNPSCSRGATNLRSSDDIKSVADLQKFSSPLVGENLYTHATRYSSDLDKIVERGINPGRNGVVSSTSTLAKAGGQIDAHKVRDMPGGYVVFDGKGLKNSNKDDVVGMGESYAEVEFHQAVSVDRIVKVVRYVQASDGFSIREDHLAAYAAKNQGLSDNDTRKLPEKYQAWFSLGTKSTLSRTKATTATEWLQDNFPHTDLEETVYATPYGNVAMNLATEFPGWMKASIRERLEETFSQSYWDDINMTTQGDIADLLNEGLENGWSVEKMAKEMNERYGEAYSKNRGRLIARTESGNALNGARVGAIDDLIGELGPEIAGTIKKVWHSVLGNTTRDTHANLDGVPADSDGRWALGGVRCRWPGDVVLPAKERCNCQCTVITQFGMSDAYAQEEIAQSEIRQMQQGKAVKTAGTSGVNCGIGPGGFQPGNTCAKGGGISKSSDLKGVNGVWLYSKVGKVSGVDHSDLKTGTKFYFIGKIGQMEADFLDGKFPSRSHTHIVMHWENMQEHEISPGHTAVIEAYNNLIKLKSGQLQELPAGAKPTKTDLAVASDKGWVKTGGSLGTEKGGTYEMGGKKYYVKTPDDPARAHNEVLAFKLYEAAGGSVVKSSLVEIDGKTSIATEWEDMQKIDWSKNTSAKIAAAEDFALHAWLNNRDAVGAGSENPMDNIKSNTGKPTLVDAGGSLNYQGMGGGGQKPFGKDAKEWDSLRDPSINPTMAKVFGDMTPGQLIASGEKLKNITDKTIDDLVSQYHGGSADEKKAMGAVLKKRRDAILQKVEELKAGSIVKSPDPVVQQSPAKQETVTKVAAASAGPVSLPPPPHAGPQVVKDKMAELYTAASSGDINKLHAVKTNPNAASPYPKKMHEYKMQLMTAMQAGGKPVQSHVVQPPATAPKPAPVAISSSPQVTLAGPVKINPGGFPSKPTFTSSNKANAAANDTAASDALKIAETGDLAALQSHGQTIPNSPKLKAWRAELVQNVAEQLNPPPPPVSIASDFAAASSHLSPKAVETAKKIGYWAVLGEVSGVPSGYGVGSWNPSMTKQFWDAGEEAAKGAKAEIKSYTGSGSISRNDALREGNLKSSAGQSAIKIAEHILSNGIEVPQDIKLSRKHGGVDAVMWAEAKPGTVISERALLSTSTDPKVWIGSTHLHLTVGPGVKGMPVKGFSNHPSENEVILPPNQRVLVTKVQKKKGNESITEVHGIILPTLDTQCCPP